MEPTGLTSTFDSQNVAIFPISFETSWRELSTDVAEHRSMFKKIPNTFYPRFRFTPKTDIAFPETSICFNCVWWTISSARAAQLGINTFSTLPHELDFWVWHCLVTVYTCP